MILTIIALLFIPSTAFGAMSNEERLMSFFWLFIVPIIVVFIIITKLSKKKKTGISSEYSYQTNTHGTLPQNFEQTSTNSKGVLPKEDSWNPYVLEWKPFLDIEKKAWIVGKSEFPVIENILDKQMKIINDLYAIPDKVETGEIHMTQAEADELDTKVRENVYKFALGTDLKTIQSLIPQEDEGKLFAEAFLFITKIKNIENAKLDPIYDPRVIEGQERARSGGLMESDLQNNFVRFSWEQAEDLVGKLFEKKGYSVTVGVPTSDGGRKRQGDFGIDVDAKNDNQRLGIQVKHWSMDVGFEDVAKTLGVAQKFNKVIIVSTKSGFTSQALEHAQNNPYLIELWDSNKFKNELRQYVMSSTDIQKSKGALPKDSKNESG